MKLPEPRTVQAIRDLCEDPATHHPAVCVLSVAVDTIAKYWVLGWDLNRAHGRTIPLMPSEVEIWYGLHSQDYGCWVISQPTLNSELRLLAEVEEWYLTWDGLGGLEQRLTRYETDDE